MFDFLNDVCFFEKSGNARCGLANAWEVRISRCDFLDDVYISRDGNAHVIEEIACRNADPVSYTHLTLPTSDLV